jgi:hypothetical protein
MRSWIKHWSIKAGAVLLASATLNAGPVEFGKAELDTAILSRNFRYKPRIVAELNLDPPETYRIEPYAAGGGHITGGDLRGLMYGLLEAAEQMRTTGRLKQTHGTPATHVRGVRLIADPAAAWFRAPDFWRAFFGELARDRFNWLQLEFPNVPGSELVPVMRNISQTAADFGVDLALGIRNFGPEYATMLRDLLAECPVIHGVVYDAPAEARDSLNDLLAAAGRRIVLYPREHDSYTRIDDTAADIRAALAETIAGFEIPAVQAPGAWPDVHSAAAWGRIGYDPAARTVK